MTRDPYGILTGFTDMSGKTTTFAYTGGRVNKITAPSGGVTTITYDSTGRVTKMEKTNTTAGSPGNSITRLSYPTSTQTLLAGPNTDPAVAITTGPRTTYTLNTAKRVTAVTDPMGRARVATYTADFDTLTATQGTGTTAGTTTNTYGANNGQSLTQSQSPTGAKQQLAYTNTAAATKYLPTSATSDAGNQSLFTYNGAGNALTSSDALASTATLSYNNDGTVATALAPGNGTNKTTYTYNANHELITITPVTGTSLANSTRTYDAWGRTKTVTSAPGMTATYTYDLVGRLTQTAFSDYTPTITYAYNNDGQLISRVDGSGTTSYGYDQMGRLITRANTAGGGTITYGYDKASNLTSTTDTRGTTSYTYDTSGVPTTLVYLLNGVAKILAFATDNRGRRTDTWLEANAAHTTWKAHTHTDYDTSGRVSRVTASTGTGDSSNTLIQDDSYCYASGTTSPSCTSTATTDRGNIQWIRNNLQSGTSYHDYTSYTYNTANQLSGAENKNVAFVGDQQVAATDTTYTYSFDARGNRTNETEARLNLMSRKTAFNAANQIIGHPLFEPVIPMDTSVYAYDASGNMIKNAAGTYSYNAAQQMTKTTKNAVTYTYTYAGVSNNELVAQTTPQGNYQYTYGRTDAQGQPIIEQVKLDGNTAYIEHDPVTGEPLMLRTSDGMQSLYISDGNGSSTFLINSNGVVKSNRGYTPTGVANIPTDNSALTTTQNPYTFKNGINDRTTSWIKYGARYYNPNSPSVWTQQDSLDAPLNPANANRYAYAANNPINYADPTGQSCVTDTISQSIVPGAIVGTAVGAGFGAGTGAVLGLGVGAPVGAVAGGVLGAIEGIASGFATGLIGGLLYC
ncbi:hypothetical protein CVS30_08630 [Arthrobacter psychrolactophilus]|uniref:Teneurin-like YD-shell domain-containing protein n=1 Tax=Arthrobacter psychrolactophilus TaxID=92442 RepID=A0A2V5JLV2_9MICC|nr:RHS repeat-associated core domain-containing protein [Arthrobacter psychrolactophilus]PYI38876.1 hypothetical protein CVS30_08630 [Arthrobacter psychrolactophilus]